VRPDDPTDHDAIEELLAGYVLRSLSGADADEADRLLSEHVPACSRCQDTLLSFRDVAGDLALDASPMTPPDVLLPRLHRELDPREARRHPFQLFAVAAGVAAIVGLAGLAVSQGMRANDANAEADDLRAAAQMALRPDASRDPVGPVRELSAPGVDEFYIMGTDCPPPPEGMVYRVWVVSDGQPIHVGDFLPVDGEVFVPVPFDPATYDLLISVEAADSEPTTPTDVLWRSTGSTAA
jgi:Anti-sigma-K factor rskA